MFVFVHAKRISPPVPGFTPPSAVLCVFAKGDVVEAERKVAQYGEMDYTIAGSKQLRLATSIIKVR
jgi:hypothetical protein